MAIDKNKILAGREAADAYRAAHAKLYNQPWHKGVPEEHTPLLEKLVADLEKQGYTSECADFKDKSAEVLAKFWADSDLRNLQDLGYNDRADFDTQMSALTDEDKAVKQAELEAMWK